MTNILNTSSVYKSSYLIWDNKIHQIIKYKQNPNLINILQQSLTKQFGGNRVNFIIDSYDFDGTLVEDGVCFTPKTTICTKEQKLISNMPKLKPYIRKYQNSSFYS